MRAAIQALEKAYEEYLDAVYEEEDISGFDKWCDRNYNKHRNNQVYSVYGELLPAGFRKLTREITFTEEDVFYDLGSGVGKLVLQALTQTPVKAAYGIEGVKERHLLARRALRCLKEDFPDLLYQSTNSTNSNNSIKRRTAQLICGNFLTHKMNNATIIYTCSVCFSDKLMRQLAKKINALPKVKYVVSLTEFENLSLPLHKKIKVPCCWEKAGDCFIYKKVED